jgi:hypothetical protein
LVTIQMYQHAEELWDQSKDGDGSHDTWYKKAVSYWDKQEPTYDGVLGGFGFVSEIDVRDSKALLEKVAKVQLQRLSLRVHGAHAGRQHAPMGQHAPTTPPHTR